MGHANLRREREQIGAPYVPNRPHITCTKESCYANTRQHSAALTAWRAENESPIFADDREEDGGRLYRSRRNDTWLARRWCQTG